MAAPPATPTAARALYRSLLRVAMRMPDDHRRAFVVHRTRSEFDKSRSLTAQEDVAARLLEGEIYRDQLEFQAQHLTKLTEQQTLIPVDLRSSPASPTSPTASSSSFSSRPPPPSSTRLGPSRPARPSRPLSQSDAAPGTLPTPPSATPPPTSDRGKLARAISARDSHSGVLGAQRNRFMEGPEPSWIRRRREEEQKVG